jgi:hypothetical protein
MKQDSKDTIAELCALRSILTCLKKPNQKESMDCLIEEYSQWRKTNKEVTEYVKETTNNMFHDAFSMSRNLDSKKG